MLHTNVFQDLFLETIRFLGILKISFRTSGCFRFKLLENPNYSKIQIWPIDSPDFLKAVAFSAQHDIYLPWLMSGFSHLHLAGCSQVTFLFGFLPRSLGWKPTSGWAKQLSCKWNLCKFLEWFPKEPANWNHSILQESKFVTQN